MKIEEIANSYKNKNLQKNKSLQKDLTFNIKQMNEEKQLFQFAGMLKNKIIIIKD